MSALNVTASQFKNPYTAVNGAKTLNISRRKCIKFATTVGLSHLAPTHLRSKAAVALSTYRAMAVRACLDFGHATLRPVAQYRKLETSEKANISYWIGMTFAAIAADDLLHVPRLVHAQKHHGVIKANNASKSLADLVGRDNQKEWHVVEAKARKLKPSAKARTDWKAQAATIASVNGKNAATRSYCFGTLQTPCEVELVDPPPHRPSSVNLRFDAGEFDSLYYQPFLEFLRGTGRNFTRDGRSFVLRVVAYDPIDDDYMYVGLEEDFFWAAKQGTQFRDSVLEFEDADLYVATDGVAVMTSKGPCDL